MTPLLPLILEHVIQEYPREACGLIVDKHGTEFYVPCLNLADGQAHFIMDPMDIANAEQLGVLKAVVHSHPNAPPEPSQADLVMMERWGIPWLIVNWPTGEARWHKPSGYLPPLLGREFSHGVLDCFALVRDYYKLELGIDVPDFDRPDDWWNHGGNLYLENYGKAGFVDIGEAPIQKHDVCLIQFGSPVPNHAGVYLGDGVIMHHVTKRLSRREGYSGYWQRHTQKVVRHRTLCSPRSPSGAT